MFNGIQTTLFDTPEFKEDSVRELIIAPMISRLGYLPTGIQRVARSKTVKHPFIRIGTKNHPVTLIPDYIFFHEEKPIFVLDAKAPNESVLDDNHIRQVYSYAIHPEIKCKEFAICNGRKLAVFHIDHNDPIIVLDFEDFEARWSEIEKLMSPKYLTNPILRKFRPDLGLTLKRLGFKKDANLVMPFVRLDLFMKMDDQMMTAGANCDFVDETHCVSFDFPTTMLDAILAGLPKQLSKIFIEALNKAPFHATAGLVVEIDVEARLGEETRGVHEAFIPLIIQKVKASRFNPEPVDDIPQDIPDHVFQLRKAFKIKER